MYGFMLNPSSYGSVLVTAAMLELSALASAPSGLGWRSAMRWLNYASLIAAVLLTLSRSSWVTLAVGAGVLLFLWAFVTRARRPPPGGPAAGVLTLMIPVGLLLWIASVQWQSITEFRRQSESTAQQLRSALVSNCLVKWDPPLCDKIPPDLIEAARQQQAALAAPASTPAMPDPAAAKPSAALAPSSNPVTPSPAPVSAPAVNPNGALMNARGLNDRVAILRTAWSEYVSTPAGMLFGTGIGRFMVVSAPIFGVPLIIHNTPMWFLVEMGPVGLAALLWLLGRTALNLWSTRRLPDWQGDLSRGLAAASAAWLAFAVFNEAFYVRHLWLLLLCADRLYVLAKAPQPTAS